MSALAACVTAAVLLLDASNSIQADDWRLQVHGHAAALASPAVTDTIERNGAVAVAVHAFAVGVYPVLGWRVLRTADDARAFARDLSAAAAARHPAWNIAGTASGDAVARAVASHEAAPCEAERKVIDLVTDGPATAGATTLTDARDMAEVQGIRVNALVVKTGADDDPEATMREWAVTSDGFVLVADGWTGFAAAIRRKISLEVAGLAPAGTERIP